MQLDPQFKPPRSPSLALWDLLDADQEVARSIDQNLSDMSRSANDVAAAIALFHFSRSNGQGFDLFRDWLFLAARDGAMSIRNFGTALAKVRDLIGRIPAWLLLVYTNALKEAEKEFHASFPFAHKMRHSVAHPELYSDPTKNKGFSGDFEGFGFKLENVKNATVHQNISDNTFASTFEGAFVHYDLNDVAIRQIVRLSTDGFRAIAKIHRDQSYVRPEL